MSWFGNISNKIDANLIPGNIKNGVSVFWVSGTFTGSTSLPWWPADVFSLLGTYWIDNSTVWFKQTSIATNTWVWIYEAASYIYVVFGFIFWVNFESITDTNYYKVYIQKIDKSDLSVTSFVSNTWYYVVKDSSSMSITQSAWIIYIAGNSWSYVTFDTSTDTFAWFSWTNNAYITTIWWTATSPWTSTTAFAWSPVWSALPTTLSFNGSTFWFQVSKNSIFNASDDVFGCCWICFVTYW